MDISLASAMVTLAREDGDAGYEGASMFSALPGAPVIEAGPREARRAARREARLRRAAVSTPSAECAFDARPATVG